MLRNLWCQSLLYTYCCRIHPHKALYCPPNNSYFLITSTNQNYPKKNLAVQLWYDILDSSLAYWFSLYPYESPKRNKTSIFPSPANKQYVKNNDSDNFIYLPLDSNITIIASSNDYGKLYIPSLKINEVIDWSKITNLCIRTHTPLIHDCVFYPLDSNIGTEVNFKIKFVSQSEFISYLNRLNQ